MESSLYCDAFVVWQCDVVDRHTRWSLDQRSYSTSGPVGTGMGDSFRRAYHLGILTNPLSPTQLTTLSGTENSSTGQRAVMLHGWVVKEDIYKFTVYSALLYFYYCRV